MLKLISTDSLRSFVPCRKVLMVTSFSVSLLPIYALVSVQNSSMRTMHMLTIDNTVSQLQSSHLYAAYCHANVQTDRFTCFLAALPL